MKHLIPFLALAFSACLSQEKADPDPFPEVLVQYVLSPEASLKRELEMSAFRWNQARGCTKGTPCEILVQPGGIPVLRVPEILRPDGTFAAGTISPDGDRIVGGKWKHIYVSAKTRDVERTLMHEMSHMFMLEHSETGVGCAPGLDIDWEDGVRLQYWTISEENLTGVCTATTCLEFNPEDPIK